MFYHKLFEIIYKSVIACFYRLPSRRKQAIFFSSDRCFLCLFFPLPYGEKNIFSAHPEFLPSYSHYLMRRKYFLTPSPYWAVSFPLLYGGNKYGSADFTKRRPLSKYRGNAINISPNNWIKRHILRGSCPSIVKGFESIEKNMRIRLKFCPCKSPNI